MHSVFHPECNNCHVCSWWRFLHKNWILSFETAVHLLSAVTVTVHWDPSNVPHILHIKYVVYTAFGTCAQSAWSCVYIMPVVWKKWHNLPESTSHAWILGPWPQISADMGISVLIKLFCTNALEKLSFRPMTIYTLSIYQEWKWETW